MTRRMMLKKIQGKGRMPVARPKRTKNEVLKKNLENKGLDSKVAHNHASYRATIR